MLLRLVCVFASVLLCTRPAWANPPIDAFGALPDLRAMTLSPDGSKVAFISRQGDADVVALLDRTTGEVKALLDASSVKARSLWFATSQHLIIRASDTTVTGSYFRGESYEYSGSYSYNVDTNYVFKLLDGYSQLHPAQTGLGRVLGVTPDGAFAFMPAHVGRDSDASLDLLRVDLNQPPSVPASGAFAKTSRLSSNSDRIPNSERGTVHTIDWFVGPDGRVLAREDYNNDRRVHSVFAKDGPAWREIYHANVERPEISVVGATRDGSALVFTDEKEDEAFFAVYQMSLADGSITGPLMQRPGVNIGGVLVDKNDVFEGVRYSGMFPTYEFVDPELTSDIANVQAQFPGASVWLGSRTTDWSKILVSVSAGGFADRYFLYDRTSNTMEMLGDARPALDGWVAEVDSIEYQARDGLTIPSVVTWPVGVTAEARANLPMVVMPHGGPWSYDSVEFDYRAQYFANEGYLVLQPNFRGSTGFGVAHRDAGEGEWGRKMQDDISDGVQALVSQGWADPNRVCIVGWSYGGYAALAGAAFTPELYKCAIAGAPVTDLVAMLVEERLDHGANHWLYRYWNNLIGDPRSQREHLRSISPSHNAASITAPILLLHGDDDTVVPYSQSRRMRDALRDAGKPVEFVTLKGEDHWLSRSETRLEALQAMGDFLRTHLN